MSIRSRLRPVTLTAAGAICAGALGAASPALAAPSGGATTNPNAHGRSAPFTIGFSDTTVKPGQRLTISGLAYARAGRNLTILSHAFMSARRVEGRPAVVTPALVEGIYHTSVRISPTARPGVYAVLVRFANRQVASAKLRVVRPDTPGGRSVHTKGCAAIGFTVLHNDRVAGVSLPAGAYTVSSRTISCGVASADLTRFLARGGAPIPGWRATSPGAGRATFSQPSSGLSFNVARKRR